MAPHEGVGTLRVLCKICLDRGVCRKKASSPVCLGRSAWLKKRSCDMEIAERHQILYLAVYIFRDSWFANLVIFTGSSDGKLMITSFTFTFRTVTFMEQWESLTKVKR